MASKAIATLLLTALLSNASSALGNTSTSTSALSDIESKCLDPSFAIESCLLAPKLYDLAVLYKQRANVLYIENTKLKKQLEIAEQELLDKKPIPPPEDTAGTWIARGIVAIVAAGAASVVTYLVVR